MLQIQDLFNADLVWRADSEAKLSSPSRHETLKIVRQFDQKRGETNAQETTSDNAREFGTARRLDGIAQRIDPSSSLFIKSETGSAVFNHSLHAPRAKISSLPFKVPQIDRALPHNGLDFGAIHEFSAYGEKKFLPPNLILFSLIRSYVQARAEISKASYAHNQEQPFILWIGKRSWPELHSLVGIGGEALRQSLFISAETRRDVFATCDLALRSRAAKVVVAWIDEMTFAVSRRFALAAQHSGVLFLLVRPPRMFSTKSAAATRWVVESLVSHQKHLLSNRSIDQSFFSLQLQSVKGRIAQAQSWEVACSGIAEGHAVGLARQGSVLRQKKMGDAEKMAVSWNAENLPVVALANEDPRQLAKTG